ncbi:type 1 glutamine amidotransferase [Patescibacteria group bacterium]|nr:type 1 glutamine amidotransferase [Patescibacteria group bacterium]
MNYNDKRLSFGKLRTTLRVGWLYPELMSTYGDRGNIIVLQKRCEWRNIGVSVVPIESSSTIHDLSSINLVFGGGAQDRQQSILIDDLRKYKGPVLKDMINYGIPGLFVCGSPQLLGHYYMTGEGEKLEGLGIFDMVSKHFGKNKPRCIGNLVAEISDRDILQGCPSTRASTELSRKSSGRPRRTVVGFENHGGRTYLGEGVEPFAHVLVGNGNNGEDGTEGAVYKNCIATYSHGPFLPKNPHIADWLIAKALEVKYKKVIPLTPLDDTLELQAHDFMLKRLSV